MKDWIFKHIIFPIWEEELTQAVMIVSERTLRQIEKEKHGRVRKSSKKPARKSVSKSKGGKNASV